MNKTKRRPVMVRLAAALAVTMMFTLCFVGGTFAKYTSSATGTDNTTVAKWLIKVGETDITDSDVFTFDLFKTIKDSNGSDAETDMSPVDGSIIAPGTSGEFEIVIENKSEVNATYAIDYTVTNPSNIPVKFSVDGTNWFEDINYLDVRGKKISMNGTEKVTVKWMWEYERASGDAADTALGIAASAELKVDAAVTATQVD